MFVSIGKVAEELGIHPETIRRLERKGKIKCFRTDGNHRRYDMEEVKRMLLNIRKFEPKRKIILYGRVSIAGQKDDLQTQIERLETYALSKGYVYIILSDVGSGINYNRKNFIELIKEVENNLVEKIVINYKDRLVRFGYEIFEEMCKAHGTEIEVINESEKTSFEQELVQDLISLITVFSAKLYGSRSHKNKKIVCKMKEMLNDKNS